MPSTFSLFFTLFLAEMGRFYFSFFSPACNEQITSLETLCVSFRYGWQGELRLFFQIGIFPAVATPAGVPLITGCFRFSLLSLNPDYQADSVSC